MNGYRSALLKSRLFTGTVVAIVVGIGGAYLLLSAYASRTSAPDTYVEYASGSHPRIVEKSNVGDIITPTIHDKNLDVPGESREKIALIISWYYVSSQVTPKPVKCHHNIQCRPITWRKFEGSMRWGAQGLFDRMFSICVDLPQKLSRPITNPDDTPGLRIMTPYFVVKKSTDAIPLEMQTNYYRGGTSCSVNGGRPTKPPVEEQTHSVMWAGGFFQCYNREANLRPGNDANGIPVYCGLGGGKESGVVTVGVQGQGGKTPGGTDDGRGGPGDGKDINPNLSSGGGGGSSARRQADTPNPTPSSSQRGDAKQPDLEPSPFFDGQIFAAGSDADNLTSTVAKTGETVVEHWPIALGVLVLGGSAGLGIWKWRHR